MLLSELANHVCCHDRPSHTCGLGRCQREVRAFFRHMSACCHTLLATTTEATVPDHNLHLTERQRQPALQLLSGLVAVSFFHFFSFSVILTDRLFHGLESVHCTGAGNKQLTPVID